MSGTTNLSELPNQQPSNVVLSMEKNQVQQQFIPDSQPIHN